MLFQGFMVVALTVCFADESSNAEKIIGEWTATYTEGTAKWTIKLEFMKDGKLKYFQGTQAGGNNLTGTYKIDKDTITSDLPILGGAKREDKSTIKKLDNDTLVLIARQPVMGKDGKEERVKMLNFKKK